MYICCNNRYVCECTSQKHTYRYALNQTVIFSGNTSTVSYADPKMALKSVFTTKVAMCSVVPRGLWGVRFMALTSSLQGSFSIGEKRWGTALAICGQRRRITSVYSYTHTHAHTYTHVYMHTHTHTHTCTHAYTHTRIHAHTHTRTHTHTHTHTC